MDNQKFRVWDGKEMIYIGKDKRYELCFGCGKTNYLIDKKEKKSIKLGKECRIQNYLGYDVYEGDYVKNAYFDNKGVITHAGIGVVTYDPINTTYFIQFEGGFNRCSVFGDHTSVEVIGNIFENKVKLSRNVCCTYD